MFWPYADYDLYDYAWWGGGYDPFFWDYGYGDIYAGLFGPYDYDALSGYAGYLPGYAGDEKTVASNRRRRHDTCRHVRQRSPRPSPAFPSSNSVQRNSAQ